MGACGSILKLLVDNPPAGLETETQHKRQQEQDAKVKVKSAKVKSAAEMGFGRVVAFVQSI